MGTTDTGQCLNIYAVKECNLDLNADGLTFSCSVEINFIPYHLTHCTVIYDVSGLITHSLD